MITITTQSIITTAAVIAAVTAIAGYVLKAHNWYLKQEAQDKQIDALRSHHDADIHAIKEEQRMLVYGVLACLKGLKEKGCDGPVTEAIGTIDKYLNKKAHD